MVVLDNKKYPENSSFLLWDSIEPLPMQEGHTVIFCKQFLPEGDCQNISIPELIEKDAAALKMRLLRFIGELPKKNIVGKPLIDLLMIRPSFSYWWMTVIAEKSFYKSQGFYDAMRLIVISDLISAHKPTKIEIFSNNALFIKAIRKLCKTRSVEYLKCKSQNNIIINYRKILRRFVPNLAHALYFLLKYVFIRRHFKKKSNSTSASANITFVDYLFNLDIQKSGRFASNYWSNLVQSMSNYGIKTNWLHLYVQHENIKNSEEAQRTIDKFNIDINSLRTHYCIDAEIDFFLICKVIKDFTRLVTLSCRLSKVRRSFMFESQLDLWHIFRRSWLRSLRGAVAMENCLSLNLFESVISKLPKQKLGFYLQENQPWEKALLHAWRSAGHGKIIGVAHSTVRYWDLRYFEDENCYLQKEFVRPDQIAVNGPVSKSSFIDAGYRESELIELEALRYLCLLKDTPIARQYIAGAKIRLLVCTDYIPSINDNMLSMLSAAMQDKQMKISLVIKPHPHCMINTNNYPLLPMTIESRPLGKILGEYDLVFASNITSAAVDAYCYGIPVIQILEGNLFNLSPLRGLNNVQYVRTPLELREALCNAQSLVMNRNKGVPYFYLDTDLHRWMSLITEE